MYPLSQQQMHIYISTKLLHSGSLWNMLAIAGYEGGNFDACAFEAALSHVLDNHSLLRSSICDCGNAEVNWVVDSRPVSEYFESVSLVKLDSNAREAAIAQLCEKESSWLFDLESTPLLRCKLVQTDVDKWVVLLNMHRIIGDIESVDIISADLTAAYYRIARGEEVSSHHALPQYSNYVSAQNSAEVSAEDIDYWKAQYETSTPPLNLPLDFTRPPLTDYRIATKAIAVDKELAVDVKECSDRCGVHTSHFLFAAFYFLLAQYSATDDIIIGNHYSDRKHHKCDFSQVVGNFVDTLPVRVHIDLADMTVSDLLKRISSLLTQSHIHRNCPFDKIIEYASPVHDIFRQLLYQAGFNYIEVRSDEREACATELRRTDCRLPIGSCDYADIGVQITSTLNNETIEQMAIDFVYSAGLFAQDTITRMADSLIRILEQMTKVETVREIVLLTAEEMEQVLLAWNDTETQFPSDKCIHHLFEAQAEKTPESVAVVYGEHQLTYQELNIRANRVAHSLLSMGVTPKTHVGICLKPTTDLLVAAIGVLKTGAAYVPLDPAYPQERLQSMVQAADISVLISQKESLKAITVLECTVLNLDEESGPLGAQPAENPNVDADPINAAYIIFTSGSTGTPKGVALCHRGVVNLLNWYVKAYEISASEKVAIISSFSFDLTQKNLFAPLTVGGQVHFLESSLYDPIYISNYIGHNGITLLNCTPSGFYPIADAAAGNDFHDMRSLRCLLLGGESMDIGRLNALCNSKTTSLRLINLYGPTECTDIASSFPIENPADFAKRPAPIGRPIYNGKLYILDKHMRPVPVGVPGELYIGGLGVGRGYINDDDQSRIKFVPNPFVQDSAGYLYKSGDRCRFLADGNIEFLGRMDHQVKIRGFRVELGEVETRLLDHPNVREAVVVAREDQSGEKWLVAYYVPSTEQAPDKGELRAFLLNSLPAYMIPSAFTKLSSIPLTPNGKIDRRSLPAPEDFHLISNVAYTAPRTDTEERVAGIWSRVLKTPAVGVEEDFFEIGGDSLRAVQVLTRLRETFQVEISLLALFEKRTIALIAGELEDLIKANQAAYVDREVLEL